MMKTPTLINGMLVAFAFAILAIDPCTLHDHVIAEEIIQPPAVETPAQRRIRRVLIGRSESARLNQIARLIAQPDQLHANMDIIVEATQTLLHQHDGQPNDAGKVSSANDPRKPVSQGLSQLLTLLGKNPGRGHTAVLIEALHHRDERIAMIAMDVVAQFELIDAIEDVAQQAKRPEFDRQYAFRFSLVRAIAQLRCPRGIVLLHQLHDQLRGQLRHEITLRLENVDAQDFGGDEEKLERYKTEHPPDFLINQASFDVNASDTSKPAAEQPKLIDSPSESARRPLERRSNYYGIEIQAARMLFVIDRSSSMQESFGYATRLHSAKQELSRVIDDLPRESEFSILLFDSDIQTYRTMLLPATDQNKREAITFVERIELGDKTNTHGVLNQALEFDDQLEAVFVLTDGKPTTGTTTNPARIIREVVTRNRTRHLKFNTIGIGVNGITRNFLQSLAEQTGGEFREAK